MKTDNIDLLQAALVNDGYLCTFLHLGKNKKQFVQIKNPRSGKWITMSAQSPLYPFATASARLISKLKDVGYDFAEQMGINIPATAYVSIHDAVAAQELLVKYKSVIVKPVQGSLSNGLTLGVSTEAQLKQALKKAQQYYPEIVVQQQVAGDEIRFVVVSGKVKAAILRQTPQVIGDGVSSVAVLIKKENLARQKINDTLVPYPQLGEFLVSKELLTSSYVPQKDEVVELNKSTMIMGGASMYNVTAELHHSYVSLVETLAHKLGDGFLVADIMVADYRQPANNNNYWFIEFNLTPALRLFYSCRDGKHVQVVENYIAPMLKTILQ